MKLYYVFILLQVSCSFGYAQHVMSGQQRANSILEKTADKLNSLTTFTYDLRRELNYASENYLRVSNWSCYFKYDPDITPVNFQYQVHDSISGNFFNGTEKFDLNITTKTIEINKTPAKEEFKDLSFLYNSIITLRNMLPILIADKQSNISVKDTVVNGRSFDLVMLNIGKRRIQNLGEDFDIMKTKSNFIYKITIDKSSHLPIEVLQMNDLNDDFIKTNFTNINTNPNPPKENTWYYPTYLNQYKTSEKKELPGLIPVGSLTTDWTLPRYDKNENITLSNLRGKVILLDFWFKNCSPCIESVPRLNAINKKYGDKNFAMLGINTWDSQKDVVWFCDKHQVTYNVLLNGKDLAENYGIDAFPTVVLIDKDGKVLYSGGFDPSKIEGLIEKAL